jgi:hypothetical protein
MGIEDGLSPDLPECLGGVPRAGSGQEGGRGAGWQRSDEGRIVAVGHLDASMCRTFRRNRELERLLSDGDRRQRRRCNGDKCVQEDGAIVIIGPDRRVVSRMVRMLVAAPVTVNGATAVMCRRVIVGMRVQQRRRQGSPLDGERQRHGDQLSHDTFILRNGGHAVKGTFAAAATCARAGPRGWTWQQEPRRAAFIS